MKIIKQEYHCTTRIHTSPITQTRPNNTKPSNLNPTSRHLLHDRYPPWKKLRWTQLGAFSCCEYPSPRADRSLWNLADVIEILGGDFCTWEDASAAGTSYTERIIRLFPMRETFLHEYFRRVTIRARLVSG